ncbi:MAG: dephospho-CoA kinase [Dehalococcoidia bacterium]
MIVVGLTGGIGSGKSTVSGIFRDLGAYIIDYDLLAREVVEPGKPAWSRLVEELGEEILSQDSTLNREKLGEMVFRNPEKLNTLNRITHPAIFDEADRRLIEIAETDPEAIVIKDVPLLIETGIHTTVDKVVVVSASRRNRIERLKARGLAEEDAERVIEVQMPIKEKSKYADYVIDNDGSFQNTRQQVEEIFALLRKLT